MPPIIINPLEQIPADSISDQDFAVFGGSFDPIHEGHVAAIRRLLSRFNEVVLAPTPQNPWKNDKAAPLELRIEMIRAVVTSENIPESAHLLPCRPPTAPSVLIERFPYVYSVELVRHLSGMTSRKFWWAVGADSSGDVEKWRDWKEHGVPVVIVPVEIDVHSTDVRSGKRLIHPAAAEIAHRSKCYQDL